MSLLPVHVVLVALGAPLLTDTYHGNKVSSHSPVCNVRTFAGTGVEHSSDGPVGDATISEPVSMVVTQSGAGARLYFTEYGGQRVQNMSRCDIGGYKCSVTNGAAPGCLSAPGRNFEAPINSCQCGCDTFFMMASGHRVRVIEDNIIRTVAGSGIRGYRNGQLMLAEFNHPYDVVLDSAGALLVADSHNHAVRKIDLENQVVSTVVGTGEIGWRDSANPTAAGVNYPTGLAIDPRSKILYIADRSNNCIRAVEAEGMGSVTTIAGNCFNGSWGHKDGPALDAVFSGPTSVAVHQGADVLYVTDIANNVVRVVSLSDEERTVTTLTATTIASPFRLDQPTGLALDDVNQELYVTSYIGGRVMRFTGLQRDHASSLEHYAGSGAYGFADGDCMESSFKGSKGLAFESKSRILYVADFFNSRIRTVSLPAADQAVQPKVPLSTASRLRATIAPSPSPPNAIEVLRSRSTPIRVMLWTGHSGPFHDHFANGKVLAKALNATPGISVSLPCSRDESVDCEAAFADPHLRDLYDVILIYADTYENPLRGSLTDAQWEGMFAFVKGGGGFFALHTASACWDNKVEHPDDKWSNEFHIGMLNCEFGGHSPYKDYVATVVDQEDTITKGMSNYIVSDELYHPVVYNESRSRIFIKAYDQGLNTTAIHGLRHTYGEGRVLYFAEGHDMAEFQNAGEFPNGNHAFQHVILRCLMWVSKLI